MRKKIADLKNPMVSRNIQPPPEADMRVELQRLQKENQALMQLKHLEIENAKLKQSREPAAAAPIMGEDIQKKEAELASLIKKQEDLTRVMELEASLQSGQEATHIASVDAHATQAEAQAAVALAQAQDAAAAVTADAQAQDAAAHAQAQAQALAVSDAESRTRTAAAASREAETFAADEDAEALLLVSASSAPAAMNDDEAYEAEVLAGHSLGTAQEHRLREDEQRQQEEEHRQREVRLRAEAEAEVEAKSAAEAATRAAKEAMSKSELQADAEATAKARAELANKAVAEAKAALDVMTKTVAQSKIRALEAAKSELARLQAVNKAEVESKTRTGFMGGAPLPLTMGAEGKAKVAAQSIAEAQSATEVAAASEASATAERSALEAAVAVIKTIQAAEQKAVMASSVIDSFTQAKLEADLFTAVDADACRAAAAQVATEKLAVDQARAGKVAADVAAAEKVAFGRAESAKGAVAKAVADKTLAEVAAGKAIADDAEAKQLAAAEVAAANAVAEEAAAVRKAAEDAAAIRNAQVEAEAAEVAARMAVIEEAKNLAAEDPQGACAAIDAKILAGEGNADDWAEAKRVSDEVIGHLLTVVKNGTAPAVGDKWHLEPAQPEAGGRVTVYYDAAATCLAGVKQYGSITLTSGCNNFEEPEVTVMKEVKGRFKVNGAAVKAVKGSWWQKAEVDVPDGAFVMDFVFSDGGNNYDNNDRADYHSAVKGAEETLDTTRFTHASELYYKLVDDRLVREKRARERNARRAIIKTKSKAEAALVTRRQREHVLFVEPAEPRAGDTVRVHYNPSNTSLAGATEVYIIGGYNRWTHAESIGPLQMVAGDTASSHVSVEFTIPSDAFKMDFVFSNSADGTGSFDNNNKLDYHVPVTGGVHKVTGEPVVEPPLHVVSICVEMAPIAKVGGLGDVVTSLARAVQDEGHNVEVILPKHDTIDYTQVEGFVETTGFSWGMTYNRVFYGKVEGVDTYFIDPENGMFRVGMIYGTDYLEIPMTDAERFGFFSKAALEWLLQSKRQPDIIHCHDWQTAPCAKSFWQDYQPFGLSNPRVVFTIHNLNYGAELIEEAMSFAQVSTTVSRTYAEEISSHQSIRDNLDKFHGVVNGIDPEIWDPANDDFLPRFYDEADMVEGKAAAREALCNHSNIPNKAGVPMVGVVTRLSSQKGIHLIKRGIMRSLERGCQVVLLGSAPDPVIQQEFDMLFHELKQSYHDFMCFHLYYNEPLSHLIYAGSDMLLVPSMFEPCGLSQLIAMRYGTVPIVRRTGGLNDTVFDYDMDHKKAEWEGMTPNGFSFDGTNDDAIDYALNRGMDLAYNKPAEFRKLQANCMSQDWSWNRCARMNPCTRPLSEPPHALTRTHARAHSPSTTLYSRSHSLFFSESGRLLSTSRCTTPPVNPIK